MLFGPQNSIIFVNDILEADGMEAFEARVQEAKKFYKAVLLSELIEKQKKGKRGYFALCFKQARINFQLKALPFIQEFNTPCTLFIQPECVGTNRLPLLEEISWFKKEYPLEVSDKRFQEWKELIEEDQSQAEESLQVLRKELGAMPIQKIGPESFYLKWGDLLDLNPEYFEFGLHLSSFSEEWISASKKYAESQLGRSINTAYSKADIPLTEDKMMRLGFIGLVTECVGAVEKGKSRFNLPQWVF